MSERESTPAFAPAFAPVGVAAMLIVGVLCFTGFVVLFALARGPGEQDGGPHAASRSAVGYAGIVQLLRDTGTPVVLSRAPVLTDAPGTRLLVLTPRPGTTPPRLIPGQLAGGVLLVLPKWRTRDMTNHPGWVETAGLLPTADSLGVIPAKAPATVLSRSLVTVQGPLQAMNGFSGGATMGPISSLQSLAGSGFIPLLVDANQGLLLGRRGSTYVLSDPDLLNDAGIASADTAAFAVSMLRTLSGGQPVTFDLSLDGFGRSRDPLRAIFQPPLLGATLCAAMAALLLGLLSAVRFGPAQPARRSFALGKAALAANAAGLIARAGRETRMAVPYLEITSSLAARALGLSRGLTPEAETALLDQLARERSKGAIPLAALREQASSVRKRAGLLEAARAAYHWRQELVRGHR